MVEADKQVMQAEKIIKQHKNLPNKVVKEFAEVKKALDKLNKQSKGRKMIDCEGFSQRSKVLLKAEKTTATEAKKAK